MRVIIFLFVAILVVGCAGKLNDKSDKIINDGHDYQWTFWCDKVYLIHSPECDSCKAIRREETIELLKELKIRL